MSGRSIKFAAPACLFISTVEISIEIARQCASIAVFFEQLAWVELPTLLLGSIAVLVHLALEREIFDWLVGGAHLGNLLVGWLGVAARGLTFLVPVANYIDVHCAATALLMACFATLSEIAGLRRARRRRLLTLLALSTALSLGTTRVHHQALAMPPRTVATKINGARLTF